MADAPEPRETPTRAALFLAFLKIGCLGFGGVAAFARHVLVVERGFMTERDFAETFGLASSLPGANTVNLATMLGDRFRGPTGSLAALAGLLGGPLLILIAVASIYQRTSDLPDVKAGLAGAAAATAGLVLGTSVNILRGLDPDIIAVTTAAIVCLAAAVFHAPMLGILVVIVPLSLLAIGLRGMPGVKSDDGGGRPR